MNKQTAEEQYLAFRELVEYLKSSKDEPQSWDDHEEAVEAAEEEEVTENDILDSTSLVDKLGVILHMVTNKVIKGQLLIESGDELLAMSKAVVLREQLRAATDK